MITNQPANQTPTQEHEQESSPSRSFCSVCVHLTDNPTRVTVDTAFLDDFGWCYNPAYTYEIDICAECQRTDENPNRLIPQAYEEWREWHISALADSIDSPVMPDQTLHPTRPITPHRIP